jgi:proteasome lid subunit RPN8/RPN11
MSWRPTPDHVVDALAHARRAAPAECCGAIAGGFYRPLANLATEHDSFVMDMRGFIAATRQHRAEAIVHSHVDHLPTPSEADRAMCEKLGLPWLIVSHPSGTWTVIEPCGWKAPLVGRQWAWGTQDCFGIVRDGLKTFAGIAIPDFGHDWNFWKEGGDPVGAHFAEAGFRVLPPGTPPRHCDVLGMKMPGSPVVSHLALFLEPDIILHQMAGRLSRRDLFDGLFQKLTFRHFRHLTRC